MPETTVGLQDNNLFGNLIANTRMPANNPGSQTLNINSIQSDAKAEDVEDIENVDNMPFQEILGQHIFNLNIYNPFAGVNNGHPSISPFVPLSQRESKWGFEERKGINVILDRHLIETYNPSSIFSMEKSNVNAVDKMDKPFIPDMDVRNTLPKTDTLKLNPLNNPETLQVSGASSLNNMQQSGLYSADSSEINMKELPETYKLLAKYISPENKNGSPFSLDSKTTASNAQSNVPDFQQKTKTSPNIGSANVNIYNPFPNTHNGNPITSPFVPLSQRESKWGFEERTGNNVLPDKQISETRNPGSIFSLEKPFIQDMDVRNTLPKTDTLKLNPLSNPEIPQISGASSLNNMQQSDFYSADSSEINMKELPETYKLLAQYISPENKNSMQTPVINGSSKNTTEQHTESVLSKINGAESSRQDVSSISQTNEEWNSFDNHTQKQNTSDTVSFDAHTPKTNNGTPFSLDSQTTASNAQSNVPDFQQNTKASPNSGAPLSSSTADAKTVNHIFHSNDMSNVGHTHENIMEQIFQKIRITTHGDRSEIKLSLNPPELGNIKIHFMEENDEIEAKIYVENAEVKAAVEKNAHHLKESVAANGIEIHKLEVYIQNDDANKQKLTEYFDAYNPHHNQSHSQKGYDEDQILSKEDIPGNLQTEISASTSNLMVDYLI